LASGLLAVRLALKKAGLAQIDAHEWRQSVVLTGKAGTWAQYITAGYAAANRGYKGVANNIEADGIEPEESFLPPNRDTDLEGQSFDVAIIGGGVTGAAVARELARWDIKIALFEKEEDLAKQASGRNNGMIHCGLATRAGTKKSLYNLRGNKLYSSAAGELGFKLAWPGQLVLLPSDWQRILYPVAVLEAARKGVEGIRLLSRRQVFKLEPNATGSQHGAIMMPATGIVAPYQVTVAYAENAVQNGASVFLNTAALGFVMDRAKITGIITNRGTVRARLVINAAGVWADKVAGYAGDRFFTIHPRKGVMAILDKRTGAHQKSILSMSRLGIRSHSKGGSLTPTVDGNILMGPNALEVPCREDFATSPDDIDFLLQRHLPLNNTLRSSHIITYYAGVRPCTFEEDFIIEPSQYVTNLIHAAGIQSPGLSAAPAIAVDVAEMAVATLKREKEVRPNPNFDPIRRSQPLLSELSLEERAKAIAANPSYGRIVCRCEAISEGEIVDALRSPLPVDTLDAVKRRTRAGMGRCQGSFCTPAVLAIVAGETGQDITAVCKKEAGSQMLLSPTKGPLPEWRKNSES
jgi:glycerol-3-phosphate dehydrogenase